jgi:hypothetical protein
VHHLALFPHWMLFIGAALLLAAVARQGMRRDGVIIRSDFGGAEV